MRNLGSLSMFDRRAGPQDFAKARQWFEKAAGKGDVIAARYLGFLYANGYGVRQDYAKAREWFETAADKGDARAMRNLGAFYDNGYGVAKDAIKARELYQRAAEKGEATAIAILQQLPVRDAVAAGHYVEALRLQDDLAAKAERPR